MDRIRTLLVVSDGPIRESLVERMSDLDDFSVLAVSSSYAAVSALVQRFHPQLLIIDAALSDKKNLRLLDLALLHRPKPRLMLVTPYYTEWAVQQIFNNNVELLYPVPFSPDELLEQCRRLCAPERYADDVLLTHRAMVALDELGVPPRLDGYRYLAEAIAMSVPDETLCDAVTKVIYPRVARRFGSTSSCVERSIRNAIGIAWERGDALMRQKYANTLLFSACRKPANGAFIFAVADRLRAEYREAKQEAI